MLGKIINGVLVTPSASELKKVVITNPTEELLKFIMGYKDLVIDEKPEVTEGQTIVPIYEETETEILQHWEIKDGMEYEGYFAPEEEYPREGEENMSAETEE